MAKRVLIKRRDTIKTARALVSLYNSPETGKTNVCTCDKCACDKCSC